VRDHNDEHYRVNRRWSYIGKDALPNDPTILTWAKVKTGLNAPYWDGNAQFYDGKLVNPALWQEDMYYFYQNRLAATVRTHEVISGYYLMSQGRVGRFGYLAGARREITDTTGYMNVRSHTLTTAAQQTADPLGSALKDYNNPTKNEGDYGQTFPSIHTWYDLTANLKMRGSWTTGMARPSLANAVTALGITDPSTSNNGQGTITYGNPALRPTKSQNWDFSAEYYFEPSSSLTIGWFRKRMDDYILSNQLIGIVGSGADNGFAGQYSGYQILANSNAGTAYARGWEVSYVQQFRFLPGPLKGLRLNANWTELRAHGNYGVAGAYFKNKDVNGFIPRTLNAGLNWDYKKFGASFTYNFTSESIRGSNSNLTATSRNRYMRSRDLFNMNLRYQITRGMTFNFGVQNIFNEPQRYYRGIPDQMETFLMQGTTITGGIEGRF
jgi:TonB-dependent receptor